VTALKSFVASVPILLASAAGPAYAASQTLHSRRGDCRITVPANWQVGMLIKSSAKTADGSMWAVISSSAPGTDLALSKKVMEASYPPIHVYEDTARRLFYRYDADGKAGYYVGVPGKGIVCGAQITLPKGNEALARQIAMSVAAAP